MNLEHAAQLAPIATAAIALIAACVALRSMYLQRDIARRRAAIDFFIKTDVDGAMTDSYHKFKRHTCDLSALMKLPNFHTTEAYADVRHYLNICELIAVGINHGAFSERVSIAYWGDWLPKVYDISVPLITFVRQTPGEGRATTYDELEVLCQRWGARAEARPSSLPRS